MKVLNAIQATGNGHIARAKELIPNLNRYVDLDILVSGYQSNLSLTFPVKYRYRGMSFYQNDTGGIRYFKSIQELKARQLVRDINRLPVRSYDFIINDFEPISAWAARIYQVPCIALSHQASFYNTNVPRPNQRSTFQEIGLRYFAPADDYIGFHFQHYSTRIEKAIIRSQIRSLSTSEGNHILVYLPGFSEMVLESVFKQMSEYSFHIFSKKEYHSSCKHLHFHTIGSKAWYELLASSYAVIMGAGFEGPAEVLHLGKRLIACPLKGQYEQQCYAAALKRMGIPIMDTRQMLNPENIRYAIAQEPLEISYPDRTDDIFKKSSESWRKLCHKSVDRKAFTDH